MTESIVKMCKMEEERLSMLQIFHSVVLSVLIQAARYRGYTPPAETEKKEPSWTSP